MTDTAEEEELETMRLSEVHLEASFLSHKASALCFPAAPLAPPGL